MTWCVGWIEYANRSKVMMVIFFIEISFDEYYLYFLTIVHLAKSRSQSANAAFSLCA